VRFVATTLTTIAGIAAVALAGSCSEETSRLAKDDTVAGSGGGLGGSAGEGGAGGSGGAGAAGGASSSSGGPGGIVEPAGETKLTVVNGVVDQDAVRFCFVPFPAGATSEQPWPGAQGLSFAGAEVVSDLSGVIPSGVDVEVQLVAGDLGQAAGLDCGQIAAAAAPIELHSLGVLPASVFAEPKSLLLVSRGCTGGAGHTDAMEEAICGAGYAPDQPTAGLVAGFMSRIVVADRLALQFVHAAAGLAVSDLWLLPGQDNVPAFIAVEDWSLGAIAPFPPFSKFPVSTLGDVGASQLEVFPANQGSAIVSTPLSGAFANSALSAADLVDERGMVFVAVGAAPTAGSGSWWRPFSYTAVWSDP
jgi:hypothetical protein